MVAPCDRVGAANINSAVDILAWTSASLKASISLSVSRMLLQSLFELNHSYLLILMVSAQSLLHLSRVAR